MKNRGYQSAVRLSTPLCWTNKQHSAATKPLDDLHQSLAHVEPFLNANEKPIED